MAVYGMQITKSFKAAVDLSSYQYTFVSAGSIAGEVIKETTINGSVLGVLQNDPKATEEANVCLFGLTKVCTETEDGASPIVVGGLLKCASSGKAIGTAALVTCPPNLAGFALEAVATGSGAYIEMFLRPQIGTWNV
jgi:hypothetical protein